MSVFKQMSLDQVQAQIQNSVGVLLKINDEPLVKSAIEKLEQAYHDLEKVNQGESTQLEERR